MEGRDRRRRLLMGGAALAAAASIGYAGYVLWSSTREEEAAPLAPSPDAGAKSLSAPATAPVETGAHPAPDAPCKEGEIMLMQYNVENLFDAEHDAGKDDEEFTPAGRQKWTAEKLAAKMAQLAKAIRWVNGGRGPDILALQEVENIDVLKQLVAGHLHDLGYGDPVLVEGPDARGIDVALVSRFPLAGEVRHHDPHGPTWRKKSRLILEVPLQVRRASANRRERVRQA